MSAPPSLSKQRFARCRGELYRGCGIWPQCWGEGQLEPPFEPFDWANVTRWDLALHSYDAPYQGQSFAERLNRLFRPLPLPSDALYCTVCQDRPEPLCIVTVSHYADDEITYPKAEQLLLALGSSRELIAFELFGIGPSRHRGAGEPRIEVRFACNKSDVPLLESQLHSLYPRSAVVTHEFEPEGADCEWADRTGACAGG